MKNMRRLTFAFISLAFIPCLAALAQGATPASGTPGAPAAAPAEETVPTSFTVPFVLDHNRMLVDMEIQRADGTWRAARIWIDTGEPRFSMSEALARDLGIDLSGLESSPLVPPPANVRIGGMPIDFSGIETLVGGGPAWMFNAMHNDGHISSKVLQRYQVVFDYPARTLTIAKPGTLAHRGVRAPAAVNPETGIVQIDAVIDGDSLSFALDMGASYSFVDADVLERITKRHPESPRMKGAAGCANMWGWWPPDEERASVVRAPEIVWGGMRLTGVGLVGVAAVAPGGPPLGAWYSQKAARPVRGFLGPNAFKDYRVEIDYEESAVYFEKGAASGGSTAPEGSAIQGESNDMDLVGLTLRPENDGSYTVIGIVKHGVKATVEGVVPGDRLLRIGDLEVTGATMGTVVDALRGKPGDICVLVLERDGGRISIKAPVKRLL